MTALHDMRPDAIADLLSLRPDLLGGWSRWEVDEAEHLSVTLHLLGIGDCLEWHRAVGGAEAWTHLAGSPLALSVSPNGHDASAFRLGPNASVGDRPALIVADRHWRTAEPLGEWTLVSRTLAPANATVEQAPPGWRPVPREHG